MLKQSVLEGKWKDLVSEFHLNCYWKPHWSHFNKGGDEQIFKLLGIIVLFERYIKAKRLHSGTTCDLIIVSSVTLIASLIGNTLPALMFS